MEPNSPKKIQFAVPLFQSQLDPQAAEHIRKRRPTPATLVIYNEPSPSGDDKQTTSNQTEAQSAQLSPAQRKQSVYTPPTMRGREQSDNQQDEREIHHPSRLSQKHLDTLSEQPGDLSPRRKDTLYQHQPPFIPGIKMLKKQTNHTSPFQEEEENSEEWQDSQVE
ncbi:protein phosphatase 1 regulatory subunit 1C-like isoform X2 [Carassius gibelio]|uniref:protein phosphatase 1 regulatory subunit 1C-like isoform X2 n=1 Tax=Carassius gibelio TaxID=101364 RepID=UPI0022790451|nr:protein phosphatase 1 regulatory subunit 1C-like isoform X2 [Carassius gibelio]